MLLAMVSAPPKRWPSLGYFGGQGISFISLSPIGHGAVEVKGLSGLLNVNTQLLPSIGLGKDVLGQALGNEAAILLLGNLKNQLAHNI